MILVALAHLMTIPLGALFEMFPSLAPALEKAIMAIIEILKMFY